MYRRSKNWSFALIALLLLTQLALVVHQENIAAHAAGDVCEWCLAAAPLGAALPSLALPVLPPAQVITPIDTPSSFQPAVAVIHRGRGPPIYSI